MIIFRIFPRLTDAAIKKLEVDRLNIFKLLPPPRPHSSADVTEAAVPVAASRGRRPRPRRPSASLLRLGREEEEEEEEEEAFHFIHALS